MRLYLAEAELAAIILCGTYGLLSVYFCRNDESGLCGYFGGLAIASALVIIYCRWRATR